jgi:hypothetical protein
MCLLSPSIALSNGGRRAGISQILTRLGIDSRGEIAVVLVGRGQASAGAAAAG